MTGKIETSSRLDPVLDLFPTRKHELLRLSLKDSVFRSLCDDLCDAHESLARFLAFSEIGERPEVAEYRGIIAELEAEVRRYIGSNG